MNYAFGFIAFAFSLFDMWFHDIHLGETIFYVYWWLGFLISFGLVQGLNIIDKLNTVDASIRSLERSISSIQGDIDRIERDIQNR